LASATRPRENLVQPPEEHWRPPRYDNRDGWGGIKSAALRFLDLQAGTVWDDLSTELPKVTGSVLDAGCGLQPYRRLFSTEARYLGIDTSDSKAHFGYEAPDTRYFSGNKWPVKNQSMDFILSTETLEHVPEPLVFLREAFRCLRPGGRLLMTIPFAARWHFAAHDYWRYTPAGLNLLLTKAGFEKVEIFARGNQLTVACYKVMAFILSLLFPLHPQPAFRWLLRLSGFLGMPLLAFAAILANLTKGIDGSVDCLGYTVWASKKSSKKK